MGKSFAFDPARQWVRFPDVRQNLRNVPIRLRVAGTEGRDACVSVMRKPTMARIKLTKNLARGESRPSARAARG